MTTATWTNKGHSWTDPGAFTPGAPGPADTALFTGSAGDATVGGTTTIGALVVEGAAPIFTGLVNLSLRQSMVIDGRGRASFTGGGLFDGGEAVVGQTGAGTLIIGPPTFSISDSSGTAVIGQAAGSSGEVDIAGSRAAWLVNSFMWVGDNGFAAVDITDGAVLGIGLKPFNGDNPHADLVIGRHASSVGDVSISGPASGINDAGTAHVGEAGTALVDVADHGFFFAATLDLGATGHIVMADGNVSADAGTLAAGSGISGNGELDLFGVDNEGTISAEGTLDLVGTISGGGTLAIAADGALQLNNAVLGLQTVAFVGPAATLDAGGSVTGTITGFDTTDALIVAGATALSYAAATGVLTVDIGTAGTDQFHFAGLGAGAAFHLEHAGGQAAIQLVPAHG